MPAASLTIGSVSLGVGGHIVTATISGGTGSGYSPSTGVTGLTFKNTTDGYTYNISSATISGTTLTAALTAYHPTGKTITVDLSSGSNLTDSGSNTPTGQTGVSVTNNSTLAVTNWAASNSGIGKSFVQSNGFGNTANYVETILTGTDANIVFEELGAGTVYVTVDGGAETVVATWGNTGAVRVIPAYSGLSSGAHDVTVRFSSPLATLVTNLFQTTSATSPSLPTRYGPNFLITSTTLPSYIQLDNCPPALSGTTFFIVGAGTTFRFRATITQIRFLAEYVSGGGHTMTFDLMRRASGSTGAWTDVGSATLTDSTNDSKFSSVISGLDGSQEWEYAVVTSFDGPAGLSGAGYFLGFAVAGSFTTTTLAAGPYFVGIGDSETYGYALSKYHDSWIYKLARDAGMTHYNWGVPGEHIIGGQDVRSAQFSTKFTVAPYACVFNGSVNDVINESSGDTTSFQASCNTILTNAYAAWPTMRGLIWGISPDFTNTTHPRTDAAWRQANIDTGSHYSFYSSDGVVNTLTDPTAGADHLSSIVDGSGLHLNHSGGTKTADFIRARLFPPPSSGAKFNPAFMPGLGMGLYGVGT